MKEFDRQIQSMLDQLIDAGADINDLIVVSSDTRCKGVQNGFTMKFRSLQGVDLDVKYDPMLGPNTTYITPKSNLSK